MALFNCNFVSKALRKQTQVVVAIPSDELHFEGVSLVEGKSPEENVLFPTLYLYHGWSDDASCWARFTGIERYAQERGVAVVMPDLEHSYGVDMAAGNRYNQYLNEELPRFMRRMFPLSKKREETWVAGLSMGGYAALYAALHHPELYGAVASLSGVTDISASTGDKRDTYSQWNKVFEHPNALAGTGFDLYHMVETRNRQGNLPALYIACGAADSLLEENRRFVDFCETRQIKPVFDITPGGHEWAYWDRTIQTIMDWFPQKH